jgi:hypothetical protein
VPRDFKLIHLDLLAYRYGHSSALASSARELLRTRRAFETAGIDSIVENGGGAGLRLRAANKSFVARNPSCPSDHYQDRTPEMPLDFSKLRLAATQSCQIGHRRKLVLKLRASGRNDQA